MTIPRNASRANRLEITLEPDDTYRMEFRRYRDECFSIRNGKCYQTKAINEIVQTYDGVYFDQLKPFLPMSQACIPACEKQAEPSRLRLFCFVSSFCFGGSTPSRIIRSSTACRR